jgi:hypothetical protein
MAFATICHRDHQSTRKGVNAASNIPEERDQETINDREAVQDIEATRTYIARDSSHNTALVTGHLLVCFQS